MRQHLGGLAGDILLVYQVCFFTILFVKNVVFPHQLYHFQ